jgi:hypothetical protein
MLHKGRSSLGGKHAEKALEAKIEVAPRRSDTGDEGDIEETERVAKFQVAQNVVLAGSRDTLFDHPEIVGELVVVVRCEEPLHEQASLVVVAWVE